jgi:hypothetical protein
MRRGMLTALLGAVLMATMTPAAEPPADWRKLLAERLPALGHRNWVVVADSAYPAQTSPGIETVVTGEDHLTVLSAVLEQMGRAKHLRPVVLLDAELARIPEADAPGIDRLRGELADRLKAYKPRPVLHEELIGRLDKAGEKFRVLVLKTNLALPYTSVFLELDCGYWKPEAEARLRESLKAAGR